MNTSKRFFITGTDTNIGKTFVTVQLLKAFQQVGYSTLGIKPIASGHTLINQQYFNEDAWHLQQASSFTYTAKTFYSFPEFIAPHIAAKLNGKTIKPSALISEIHDLSAQDVDLICCEGVGGWEVPLNNEFTISTMAKALNFPVILVVGMRLGCLNHAILTVDAIQRSEVPIAGWIANCMDSTFDHLDENLQTLKDRLPIPLLATVPYNNEADFSYLINLR